MQSVTEEIGGQTTSSEIETLFSAGAHLGYGKSTRHPKMKEYIFGSRNNVEIFDLERTAKKLKDAEDYLHKLGANKKTVLWVGTKPAAASVIAETAKKLGAPYVNERWLGGTLTNFKIIEARLAYWANLESEKEAGGFDKYVKKEKLLKMTELRKLQRMLGGIKNLKFLPEAVVIVDPKEESTAFSESKRKKIPVVALLNTDCDPRGVSFPIPANDNSASSVSLILERLAAAYEAGTKEVKPAEPVK
ncbi:30S ribosomal protein S2 [Candidatus Giovannonibacteria bacterium RIFCSPHIGHO2_01_FULL_45_33]|uniref:Small ribosomal subunit protein uS2 n=1 Tax=Candidatus Giovannonibacteria bacterium RIFCSPLOWO2_01_FULL_45_34 TaxID=1798351 RepID=A0A1F5X071_9BACT|nr:MAG: 30S ribosomal protein S2 [Candidatus Giovannonibacteria bacterium RIFCSPHIGHO2_01_FULL_45_33]OGF71021.1 MAG: 30S ribosomal protein S2 [Candidatus Giovannonibacteria bacterium RIFCSPHIGHO2_02_FULL_44_11]OGF81296.1 MAG: 30S ribosomal protein S2 [Candidatus Giovannonibacteria bacterium RIFCSPLOWO2_01_FULL_45_34]